jgi:hypothetical protein
MSDTMRKRSTTSMVEKPTVHENIQNVFAVPFDQVIDITEDSTKKPSDKPSPKTNPLDRGSTGIPHGLSGSGKDRKCG